MSSNPARPHHAALATTSQPAQSSLLTSLDLKDPALTTFAFPAVIPVLPHSHLDTFTFQTDINDPIALLQELDTFFKSCYDIDSIISPSTFSIQAVHYSTQSCSRTSFECLVTRSSYGVGTNLFLTAKFLHGQTSDFHAVYQDIYVNFSLQEHPPVCPSIDNGFDTREDIDPLYSSFPGSSNSPPAPQFYSGPLVIKLTPQDVYPAQFDEQSSQAHSATQSLSKLIRTGQFNPGIGAAAKHTKQQSEFTTKNQPRVDPAGVNRPHQTEPSLASPQQHDSASSPQIDNLGADPNDPNRPSISVGSILRLRNHDDRDSTHYPSTLRTTQASLCQTGTNTQQASDRESLIYRMSMMTRMTGNSDGIDGEHYEPAYGQERPAPNTSTPGFEQNWVNFDQTNDRSSLNIADLDYFRDQHNQRQAVTREIRHIAGVLPKNPTNPSGEHGTGKPDRALRRASLLFSPGTHTVSNHKSARYFNPKESSMLPPAVDNSAVENFAELLTDASARVSQRRTDNRENDKIDDCSRMGNFGRISAHAQHDFDHTSQSQSSSDYLTKGSGSELMIVVKDGADEDDTAFEHYLNSPHFQSPNNPTGPTISHHNHKVLDHLGFDHLDLPRDSTASDTSARLSLSKVSFNSNSPQLSLHPFSPQIAQLMGLSNYSNNSNNPTPQIQRLNSAGEIQNSLTNHKHSSQPPRQQHFPLASSQTAPNLTDVAPTQPPPPPSGQNQPITSSPFQNTQFIMTFEWAVDVICSCLDDVEKCFPPNSVPLCSPIPCASQSPPLIAPALSPADLSTVYNTFQTNRQFLPQYVVPMLIQAFDALSSKFLEQIHQEIPTSFSQLASQNGMALSLPFGDAPQSPTPNISTSKLLNPNSEVVGTDDAQLNCEPREMQLQRLLLKINKSLNFLILNQNIQLRISLLQFYGKVVQTRVGLSQLHSVLLNPFWFLKALVNIHASHIYVFIPQSGAEFASPIPSSNTSANSNNSPVVTTTNNTTRAVAPSTVVKSRSSPSINSDNQSTSNSLFPLNGTFTSEFQPDPSKDVFSLIHDEVIQTVHMLRVDQVLPISNLDTMDPIPHHDGATMTATLRNSSSFLASQNSTQSTLLSSFQPDPELTHLGEIPVLEKREIVRLLIEIYYRILPWYRNYIIQLHQMVLLKGIQLKHQAAAKTRSKKHTRKDGDELAKRSSISTSHSSSSLSSTRSTTKSSQHSKNSSRSTRTHQSSHKQDKLSDSHPPNTTHSRQSRDQIANTEESFENSNEDHGLVLKPLSEFNLNAVPTTKGIDAEVNIEALPSQKANQITDTKQKTSLYQRIFNRDKTPKNGGGDSTPRNDDGSSTPRGSALGIFRSTQQPQSTDLIHPSELNRTSSVKKQPSILSRIFSFKRDDSFNDDSVDGGDDDDDASLPVEPTLSTIADKPVDAVDTKQQVSKRDKAGKKSAPSSDSESGSGGDDGLRLAHKVRYESDESDEEQTSTKRPAGDEANTTRNTNGSLGGFDSFSQTFRDTSSHNMLHNSDITVSDNNTNTTTNNNNNQTHDAYHLYIPQPTPSQINKNLHTNNSLHIEISSNRDENVSFTSTSTSSTFDPPTSTDHFKTSGIDSNIAPSGRRAVRDSDSLAQGIETSLLQRYINFFNCQSISLNNGLPTIHYRSPLIDNVMLMYAQLFSQQKNKSKELKILQTHLGHLEDIFDVLLQQFQSFTGDNRLVHMQIHEMMMKEQGNRSQPNSNLPPSQLYSDSERPSVLSSQQFSKRYLAFLQNDFAL